MEGSWSRPSSSAGHAGGGAHAGSALGQGQTFERHPCAGFGVPDSSAQQDARSLVLPRAPHFVCSSAPCRQNRMELRQPRAIGAAGREWARYVLGEGCAHVCTHAHTWEVLRAAIVQLPVLSPPRLLLFILEGEALRLAGPYVLGQSAQAGKTADRVRNTAAEDRAWPRCGGRRLK